MPAFPTTSQAHRVSAYYDANTQPFYLERWHPEDVHFGLFPDGADPRDHHTGVKCMTQHLVAPAAISAGDFVLDAGCGVGGASLDIARTTGAHVLGVTISKLQVDLASERARVAGLGDFARFELADCSTHLPLGDASVDVVVTIEAACHFDDKPNFLRECRRVLKPGGRLVGSDWMAKAGIGSDEYREFIQPVCSAWHLAGLETPRRWREMLDAAGFETRDCTDLAEQVLANANILARARLDLMLEVANGCHPPRTAELWAAQYDTLVHAWFERRFTIGRFFAVAPKRP
ncbi:MAG: methyltransferase domain-containing protein [Candidatus Binatia bacterium]